MTTVGIVTGAASGMGRACVERLRDEVDHLVAVDLTAPSIAGTVGLGCDITDRAAIERLVDRVVELGTFRLLVHAAGLSPSMAGPRRLMEVNVVGTQRLLDGFEGLVKPESVAVCFSSAASYLPIELLGPTCVELLGNVRAPDFLDRVDQVVADSGVAYILSKAAVKAEVQRASSRWVPLGGRVVSVSPGTIDTPMARTELDNQPLMHEQLAAHPMRRLGAPDELAAVVAFLVSGGASFVSGIDVLVDGGSRATDLVQLEGAQP